MKIGSTPVETEMTDVKAPFPGNKPRSVGMATSPFVEMNVASLRIAKQANPSFS